MSNETLAGTGTDASSRLDHLDAMSGLLWPGSQRVHRRGASRPGELLIAPATSRPRVLLPGANRRAAAAAVLAQGVGSGRAARLQRRALAAVARSGLAPWLMPDRLRPGSIPSIADHLAEVLGQPVEISSALTPQRANRKPVLQVLNRAGQTIAWVKVGFNELTAALVQHEAEVLAQLNTSVVSTELSLPQVRDRGEWNGLGLLVLSALPTRRATRARGTALSAAMLAVADTPVDGTAANRNYAQVLIERAGEVAARTSGADAAAVAQLTPIIADLSAAGARTPLASGTWHGDWTPWNCGQIEDRVLVWDWERCVGGVPRGFDALHFHMQDAVVTAGVAHVDAARQCLDAAPENLRVWALNDVEARLTAALYLVEIALRYLADGQRAAGGFGGAIETWIVPALQQYRPPTVH